VAATVLTAPLDLQHLPFSDTVELKVEANGRIALPSVFRPAFAAGGYLRVFEGPCLALWTAFDFVEYVDRRMTERRKAGLTSGQVRKVLYATAKLVRPDAQGRIVLPEELRSKVGIGSELVAIGSFDRIELWPPDRWEAASAELSLYLDFEMSTIDDVEAREIPGIGDLPSDGEA
jgi:MraZ protein